MCTADSEAVGRFAGQKRVSERERLKVGRKCRWWQCAEMESEEWCAGVIIHAESVREKNEGEEACVWREKKRKVVLGKN